MENSKPTLGVSGMILGAIGVVVCVALIIGVWVLSSRLSDRTAQVFGVVESGLVIADEQVGRVNGAIQDLQTGFQGRIEDIDLEALIARLDDLAGLVDATESTANTAGGSIRFASALMAGGMTDEVAADIDGLATNLETMSLDLEGVQENVTAFLEGRADDGVVAQINTTVDDLLVRVATVASLIDNTSSRVSQIEQNMLRWISMAKWILILLFLWIGAEQMLLFAHGWVSFAARKQS
jgi:hypothetical protein